MTPLTSEEAPAMAFGRRETRNDGPARSAGFDAAVGLVTGSRRARHLDGRECSHCGAEARIDMVDMPRTRAYLTCPDCGHTWDTDRMRVTPRAS
ncbi:hypothetical protein [Actinospongicola halichondriae]|uniref:hypothetical protein n=1 Tax=Actinospongicola halichondriae TaxID=3236844 RepID=UPI003D4190A5